MIKNYIQPGLTICAFLPINMFNPDHVEEPAEGNHVSTDGWTRLKRMFQTDDMGNVSAEANTILQVGAMSSFVGAMYGGMLHSRDAYSDFIKNNQATSFNNHFEAKRKLQDSVTKSFGRGAFRWGWRLSLFSTTFVGMTTMISVYRGKTGILEYVGAGCFAGTLYKFNMGPRGWIVGGGLGTALGLIAGLTTYGLLNMMGLTMDEARYYQQSWKRTRQEQIDISMSNYMQDEQSEIIAAHNNLIGGSEKNIGDIKS